MMADIVFKINTIPDLTLGKYNYLSENGVDGVLKLHNSFLWNLYEKSALSNVSFHLAYFYDKNGEIGNKINIYLSATGVESNLKNIKNIISASPLSDYFIFEELKKENFTESDKKYKSISFNYCSSFSKESIFFTGSDGKDYYDVPLWQCDSKGRLFAMFRMMAAIDEDLIFRIDIKAEKKNRLLRKKLSSGPIPNLHMLQSSSNGNRDYGADSILKDYEELLKSLDSMPHFSMNVFAFGNNIESSNMILTSALSESIKKGDYNLHLFEGSFNSEFLLKDEDVTIYDFSNTVDEYYIKLDKKGIKISSGKLDSTSSNSLAFLNTLYSIEEIAPFFRLPCLFDGETISLRKETVAPYVTSESSLFLGKDENGYEINFPIELLPKHAFVSGVPGSGKTNTMHHLTSMLLEKDIPFLVLEPAKKEYRALCNTDIGKRKLMLFSPGSNMKFPLHINPFEFAKGLSVSEHIRSLCSVFEGAFPLENPMPFLLDTAIEGVYRDNGWFPDTVYTDETTLEFPTMSQLYKRLEEELNKTTYSDEVRGNLESALKVRIGGLLRREMGDVFDVSKSSLSPEEWLKTSAIVELESMGNGPANFMTLMLCSLIRECLRVNPRFDSKKTRHVIFIEEAHNLIGPDSEEKTGNGANAKTAATAFIIKMLAEVRALRESVFIADQLPTAMAQEVIKNTGLKIALRLTAMDDRQLLCNSMSANSSQIENMATFGIGEALVTYEKLQRPFKMKIHKWCGEKSYEEEKDITTPKDDTELLNDLQNTELYKKNIFRSMRIFAIDTDKQFSQYLNKYKSFCSDHNKYIVLLGEKNKYSSQLKENNLLSVELEKCFDNNPEITFQNSADYRYLMSVRNTILLNQDSNNKKINKMKIKLLDETVIANDYFETIGMIFKKIKYFKSLGVEFSEEYYHLFLDGNVENMEDSTKILCYLNSVAQDLFDYSCNMYLKIKNFYDLDSMKNKLISVYEKTNLELRI